MLDHCWTKSQEMTMSLYLKSVCILILCMDIHRRASVDSYYVCIFMLKMYLYTMYIHIMHVHSYDVYARFHCACCTIYV